MITLSEEKINTLLSSPGNNKCLECDSIAVEWASFPTAVLLCSSCGRKHKNFLSKELIKSLSVSEFTQKELSKLTIGGNGRFLSFLEEYSIPLSFQNIENKYSTFAVKYYNALLEAEVNKNENVPGSVEILSKLMEQKPNKEIGPHLMGDAPDTYMALVKSAGTSNEMSFGGIFGFIGNQIYNASEYLGINKLYNNTKKAVDTKLNEYGIKEKISTGYDYAKSAGGYIVDKGKEIASSQIVQNAVTKAKEGVSYVGQSANNLMNNFSGNGVSNYNSINNSQEPDHDQI